MDENTKLCNLARAMLDETHGNYDPAITQMAALVAADPTLLPHVLRAGVRFFLGHVSSAARRDAFQGIVRDRPAAEPALTAEQDGLALRAVVRQHLMESYRLWGGLPIGRATRDDLLASAARHERQGTGHLRAAYFERSVADDLAPGARVSDVFTEDRLGALARQVGEESKI